MGQMTFQKARKRYRTLFFPMMAIYSVACIGGALLLNRMTEPALWLKHTVAFFTIAPIFAVFWLIWRYVQETDEYTRFRQLQALAIAGMITASIAGTVGFLELYEAIPEDLISPFLFTPLFFLSYGLSKWIRGDGKECV